MQFLALLIPMLANMLISIIGRIILALGITLVSFVGLDAMADKFKDMIVSNLNGLPLGVIQLFYLSGGGVMLNIIFGAITFVISYKTMTKIAFGLKK